jgi:hypothetical protein
MLAPRPLQRVLGGAVPSQVRLPGSGMGLTHLPTDDHATVSGVNHRTKHNDNHQDERE